MGYLGPLRLSSNEGARRQSCWDSVQAWTLLRSPGVLETVNITRAQLRLLVGDELGMMTSRGSKRGPVPERQEVT